MKTGIFSLSGGGKGNFVPVIVTFPHWEIQTFSEIWKKMGNLLFS